MVIDRNGTAAVSKNLYWDTPSHDGAARSTGHLTTAACHVLRRVLPQWSVSRQGSSGVTRAVAKDQMPSVAFLV